MPDLIATHTHTHTEASTTTVSGLRVAFGITTVVLIIEAVGGVLTGSMALIADAGHMLTDAGALGIALFGAWLAARPADPRRSFGYGRAEILAALANGLLLGGVSVGILFETIDRFGHPSEVHAGPMLGIAIVGLTANLASAWVLARSDRDNLNVRAALAHVLGDALGSVSAIGAALALLLFDFTAADAIAALLIAALLVVAAVRLVRDSVEILLEGAPRHLDLERVAEEMSALPGVTSVHDLHIWTVNSGFLAMSAHVDVERTSDPQSVRRGLHRLLHQHYRIAHTTIQTEVPELLSIATSPAPDPS
ncbi:MAG: cation diffusion facilitator family transporter [Myxococcota bacterium]